MIFRWFFLYSPDFQAFTVASNETDGYKHFLQTVRIYKIPLKVSYVASSPCFLVQ